MATAIATATDNSALILAALRHAKNNPADFFRFFLGGEPQEWQVEFLNAVRDNPRTAVRSAHGVGKTAILAVLILWMVLTNEDAVIVVIGPNEGSIQNGLWRELGIWYRELPQELQDLLTYSTSHLKRKSAPERCQAMVRVANKENPVALQGIHGPNILVLVDEASGVDDIVFEKMAATRTSSAPREVLCGNPNYTTGRFYDVFHRLSDHWTTLHIPFSRCTNPRRNHEYPASIEAEYGRESNQYRIMVLGEFPTSDDNTLIPRDVIVAAVGRAVEQNYAPVVWGVDPAGPGDDRSALAKRKGNILLEPVKYWHGIDTQQLAGTVIAEINRTPENLRPVQILVDVIGIGAGVADRLREEGYPVVGINVGERPATAPDRFMLLRDELWWRAKEWFEARDCQIPDQPQLIHELATVQYQLQGAGKVKLEPKYQTRRRLKLSPDLADAFVLTMHNQTLWMPSRKAAKVDTSWVR